MKPLLPMPRRLLTLSALFAHRRPARLEPVLEQDSRMPDAAELKPLQDLARSLRGRMAAEVALQEGSCRQYAPRGESQVLERR